MRQLFSRTDNRGQAYFTWKKRKTLTSEPYIHSDFLPRRFVFELQHKEEEPKSKAAVSMKEAGRNKSQSFWAVRQEEEGEL